MNIKGISTQNVISMYNNNKVNSVKKNDSVKQSDRIEISELGRSLTNYSLQGVSTDNSKKIAQLRNRVESGTYNVEAKLTAKKMIDNIKGRSV